MIEKVNLSHPEKVADRIAGAIVDLAYVKEEEPKVAVEVLIGHGTCHVIIETGTAFLISEIENIIHRIAAGCSGYSCSCVTCNRCNASVPI